MREDQIQRYSRQILLPEIGGKGQKALLNARVLYVGAGGLGCPALTWLTAAGIGTLGIMDDDVVDLSNLARQTLYTTQDVGRLKVDVACEHLALMNPDVLLNRYPRRFTEQDAGLLSSYDLIADGSDNFKTRMLINQLAVAAQKPLFSAAVRGWRGQVLAVTQNTACLACLYPGVEDAEDLQNCAEAGVVGAAAGVIAGLQVSMIMQYVMGFPVTTDMLQVDTLTGRIQPFTVHRDPHCRVCRR